MTVTVHHGDSADVLKEFADASIDSCCCDPPYGLSFMGRAWDYDVPPVELWREVYRVLKPGAHLVAFFGSRTYHRGAVAIEDAGFEIRDMVAWLYGSGFPKSLDVSKAIDKRRDWSLVERLSSEIKRARAASGLSLKDVGVAMQAATSGQYGAWYHRGGHMFFETGRSLPSRPEWEYLRQALPIADDFLAVYEEAEREITGVADEWTNRSNYALTSKDGFRRDKPASELARQWEGWGTALKPALEPVVLARKPLVGTVAQNVLAHGTGAMNIDECRVESSAADQAYIAERIGGFNKTQSIGGNGAYGGGQTMDRAANYDASKGRWPANVVHDGSAEVVEGFPAEAGAAAPVHRRNGDKFRNTYGAFAGNVDEQGSTFHADSGSAARFFYTAKADAEDRLGSKHPTVKPIDLMAWLCRLVTPPGGLILDPFAGTGTTGLAAMREGFDCILIEREAEYVADIERRLAWARGEGRLTALEKARNVDEAKAAGADLPLFGGEAA